MKKQISKCCVKALLVAVRVLHPHLTVQGTAEAAVAGKAPQSVFTKSGDLQGTLLNSNLEPTAGAEVNVVDANGKVVASAVTDKDGKFTLPDLEPGQYRLQIGEDVDLNLVVSDTSKVTNLRVVLPDGATVGAAGAGAAGGLSFIQLGAIGLVVVGGGIGIGYAVDSADDGHR